MQIHLNFYQRLILWNLIGSFQAPNLRATLAFLGLLKKIQPSDEELRDAQFVMDGAQFRWTMPSAGFGEIDVELGAEEAAGLVQALESQPAVRVSDAAWMFALIDTLRTEQVPA